MITITDAQRNSLQITKKGITVVRLSYGDETNFITIASQALPPEWTDEEYRPLLNNSPIVGSKVDMFTHKFSASEMRLEVSNGDYHPGVKFSDLVNDPTLGSGSDIGFENRTCETRLHTTGVTKWDDCIQLFKGKTRDIAHNANIIVFSVQDKREIIHTEIGTLLQNSDAADTDQGLPEGTLGKMRPEIWGDHIFFLGDDAKANDTTSTIGALVPAEYLGTDSTGVHQWFISDAQMDQINADGDDSEQQQMWGLDTTVNRFVRLFSTFTVVQNTAAGCIISHANAPIFYDHWYGKGTVIITENESAPGRVTEFADEERFNDKGFATASQGSLNPAAQANDSTTATVPYLAYDDQTLADAAINEIAICWYAAATVAGGAALGDGELIVTATDDTFFSLVASAAARVAGPDTSPTLAEIGNDAAFILNTVNALAAGESITLDAYEVYKRIQYTRNENLALYFAGKGREYTFTRGGHDEATTGAVIENPAGDIEDVYLNELGQTAADINTTNFDTASGLLTSWKFAFYLNALTDSLKMIQEMAQSCRSFVWLLPDGTINMKVLTDTYTASDRTLDFTTLTGPKFSRTKPQDLFTAVNVLYGDDSKGASNVDTGVSEDTTMQTRYNITEAQSTLNFRTKYIADSATAILLQAFLLAQWKQPHNQFEFSAGLDNIDLDIGDIIELSNVPFKVYGEDVTVNNTRAGQTIYKYWWIYNVRRSSTGVKIKAFQLHDLS